MPPKSSPVAFVKLHRIHAGAQATRVDVAGITWRGDGGDPKLKTAIAHRLATCWNILEGCPTSALLDGALLEMCMAIDAGDLGRAKAALARWDRETDMTEGRPHDCPQCLASTDDDETDEEDVADA